VSSPHPRSLAAARRLAAALRRVGDSSVAAELARRVDDLLVPRLTTVEAPLLVVLGGSTGVGKSTLLNSVTGHRVSRDGVLRPTTRVPVLVHHPQERSALSGAGMPPGVELCGDDAVPAGLALLDSPDLDSVETHNREIAADLILAADLWLAVTSPARYADAVPWAQIRRAAARRGPMAVVLNRVSPADAETVSAHLAGLLAAGGLGEAPLMTVTDQTVVDGVLPASAVAPLRAMFEGLAADRELRTTMRRASAGGLAVELAGQAEQLAAGWLGHDAASTGDDVSEAARALAREAREGT
jgi:energy-coupling factor transporter ATP-binding protein EcfA2